MKADLQYHIVKSIFYIIAIWQSLSYGMVEKWVVANEQAQRHQENPAWKIKF